MQSAGEENVIIKFKAAASTGGYRGATITFFTTDEGSKSYSTEATIPQKGAIVKAAVAEFLAAEVGGHAISFVTRDNPGSI